MTAIDFDSEYYCSECFSERKQLIKYTFLPRATTNEKLVVRVCEHCDGKELIRLANMNKYSEDDGPYDQEEDNNGI